MSSIEVAEAAAVVAGDVASIKAEIPAIDAEVTVCDDSERANEKAPETPVTEPLTNGSSAPETPKEEVRQNGEAVEVQPIVAEKVAEVEAKVPEAVKPEEKPETPAVDSLPINGLKIEDSVPEVVNIPAEVEVPAPVVVAEKIEEVVIVSEKAPEPMEETPAVVPEPEVCVVAGSAEVLAPPLPSCPPPSSLTVFAESTMAPLVDTPVDNLPVVDVEASLPAPEMAPVCEVNPVNNSPTALPNEIAPLPLVSDVPASDANIPSPVDVVAPPPVSDDTKTSELSPSIENIAVVSPSEIISPDPSSVIQTPASNPSVEIPSVVEEVIKPSKVDSALQSSPVISQDLKSESAVPEPEDLPLPAPISSEDEIEKAVVTEPVSTSVDSVLPTIENAMDSPVLQRALSDLDVSEANAAEPQSDSFPPPPPPESCPESMTELSVSESLPPPMSENSLPDTVVNSPTSETVDLPSKEEVPPPQEVEPKVPEQAKEAEVVVESAPAALEPAGDAERATPPTETAQVEKVSEVAEVLAAAPDVVAAESAPTVVSAVE